MPFNGTAAARAALDVASELARGRPALAWILYVRHWDVARGGYRFSFETADPHGHGTFVSGLTGSVPRQVARTATRPIILVSAPCNPRTRRLQRPPRNCSARRASTRTQRVSRERLTR